MSGTSKPDEEREAIEIDPIWTTSRTARQIYALGEVEKVTSIAEAYNYHQRRQQDITRLMALAASSISLLTLPQTDAPEDNLPQGDERSEQFVLEVNEYFERLDAIQIAIRSSLAHIRHSRIAPSAINAPPPNFVPPSLGVGLPAGGELPGSFTADDTRRGLQEERVERDAWTGILNALQRLKAEQEQNEPPTQNGVTEDVNMA
ncbi:unnamed protein product [Mycena citricolor]|uniref:Mediator complex subunit 11 n=1 Tax=Mycena citricolor TaxID=2018698 RepID=A0AAD2HRA3_9AGAR|nr:unnamed protein product [Mycena citricolor]CAK5280716.1 unnamed protein product [Mycena citricolor]